MRELVTSIQHLLLTHTGLPLSVYTSVHEQRLANVPIAKPLLVFVVSGFKEVMGPIPIRCPSGHFLFFADAYTVDIKNIPAHRTYEAILVEFEPSDFEDLPMVKSHQLDYFMGETSIEIEQSLRQFVEFLQWAPVELVSARKKELLKLFHLLGYQDLRALLRSHVVGQQLHDLFLKEGGLNLGNEQVAWHLAMSPSTLRRKLQQENTSFKEIKDRACLGLGLHLLQTTKMPITLIAERCGYSSSSRFTDSFKRRFGVTPSELRKTQSFDKNGAFS